MGQTGWDTGKKMADSASQGGRFLSLKDDGDKAVVAFIGEPFSRLVFWDQANSQYVDADSDDGKAFADNNPDKKPSFRASINCYVLQTGNGKNMADDERVAMFENGVTWFNDLVKCKEKYGLGIWLFEMERSGKAKDPKTTYSILPDKKIEEVPGLADKLKAAKLHDLANPNSKDDDGAAAKPAGSNGIIDDDQSAKLIAELKTLDRSELDKFLTQFEIKRVKELPTGKLDAAFAWINDRKGGGDDAAAGEVDPFE